MIETDKYSDFKIALRQFVQEVCTTLKDRGIPRRRWVKIVRKENETSFPEERRTDYSEIVILLMQNYLDKPPDSLKKLLDNAQKIPEIANVLLVDAGGKPINEEKSQLWWMMNIIVRKFIREYLNEADSTKFKEEVFNKLLKKLLRDIDSPNITVRELSPLANAKLDCDYITLSSYLIIRKLTSEELEKWFNDYIRYPYLGLYGFISHDMPQLECAVEITYDNKRHEAVGANKETRGAVADLVTTLRLRTDRNVYIAFTVDNSDSFLELGGGMSSSLKPHRFSGEKANISSANQQEIIDTWNHIRYLPDESPIRLALRRWNTVFERFDPNDALIDYWIALEALFIPDYYQELRHRSSFRIAAFLGETPDQREGIYKDLLESYDLRSRIVHGGVPTNKRKTELINITRSYLRGALIKILPSADTFDPKTIEIERLRK